MAGKTLFGRIRIVFHRSSLLTKLLILIPLVVSIAVALYLKVQLTDVKADYDALRHQAAQLEQEVQKLQQKNNDLDTVEGIQNIAKEDLGMADPDMEFFTPVDTTDTTIPE